MPEPPEPVARLVIRVADLPAIRLLIVELEALLAEMPPSPQRDRLENALRRLTAEL